MKVKDLTDIEKVIIWARMWAEYVDDEEVITMWRNKAHFNQIYFNDEIIDLNEVNK